VEFAGEVIVDSVRCFRVLETSHPPVYYTPREDVRMEFLEPSPTRSTFCEWKGSARYFTLRVGDRRAKDAAWTYVDPSHRFAAIREHLAFYAGKVDACWVDGERVRPQPGDFYGGWITGHVVGPFKGGSGSWGW
jgi:uncharacterized protein (DUF427 family)